MRHIQFTRRAIKDLQNLQSSGSLKLPQRLFEGLANDWPNRDFPHTKRLSGYKALWRSRIDFEGGSSMRLVWTDNQDELSIEFLYAALRSEKTYDIDLESLPREPTYRWSGETGSEWSLFLNGKYNASPVLTQKQQETSEKIGQNYPYTMCGEDRRVGFFAHITQSPPGTGKTIVAAIRACELHNIGWNVFLIVPERLLEEVKSFHCIQNISSNRENKFFYGTFKNWLELLFAKKTESLCSPEQERVILERLAERAAKSGNNKKLGDISIRDTLLFQLFTLKSEPNTYRNIIYVENQDRINRLKCIRKEWWQEELQKSGKKSRSEFADSIQQLFEESLGYFPLEDTTGSILIFDESQDYLLSELEVVKTVCKKWHRANHPTQLWLLGDLNQRIIPVDFDWGALQLSGYKETDWQCFRNSRNILRFSNLFLDPVEQIARTNNTRLPCLRANPDKSYEEGDRVKLICYPSRFEAENFLDRLVDSLGIKSKQNDIDKSQSLLYKLASRIKILKSESYNPRYGDILEFLDVTEAKGREFDACIIFNAFICSSQDPTSEDWWRWYTLLTRTRSRLLIIVTKEQYDLISKQIPSIADNFERINFQDPASIEHLFEWIGSQNNDLDFLSNTVKYKISIEKFLRDGLELEDPLIYLDTYEALENFKICGSERTELENQLLSRLRNHNSNVLETKLTSSNLETIHPLLSCLLLRGMGRYWDAAKTIESIRETDSIEHQRVVGEICKSIEEMGLQVEAARIKHQMLGIEYPSDYPMPHLATIDGDLIKALVKSISFKQST